MSDKVKAVRYNSIPSTANSIMYNTKYKYSHFVNKTELESVAIDIDKMIKSELMNQMVDKLMERQDKESFFKIKNHGMAQIEYKFEAFILTKQQMAYLVEQISRDTLKNNTLLTINDWVEE